jgi:murein DD-endopeptidase MepM/ murein hydrolase activator NlpD
MAPSSIAGGMETRDPLSIARDKLDAARAAASDAAERLAAAQSAQSVLTAEIERLEDQIPQLQGQADALRGVVRHRAVSLYVRGRGPSLDAFMSAGDLLEAARASHLSNLATAHDVELATELHQTAAKLAERESLLRTQSGALDQVVRDINDTRAVLDHKLQVASTAYLQVKQVLGQGATRAGSGMSSAAMRCPIDGFTVFTDDFGEPRENNTAHEGIDMAAILETPLVAVADGAISHDESAAGGHGIWLNDTHGDSYYYAHLSRYEGDPRHVSAGDVIGYVGVTGITTGPHLHFEVHPQHGDAIDAFPLLLALCVDEMALPRARGV